MGEKRKENDDTNDFMMVIVEFSLVHMAWKVKKVSILGLMDRLQSYCKTATQVYVGILDGVLVYLSWIVESPRSG